MKLFVKNGYVHDRPGLVIYDENEKEAFCASVSHSALGINLDVYRADSKRVAKIRQRGGSFDKSYTISADKQRIKLMLKVKEGDISAFIKGIDWKIDGDLPGKNFYVYVGNDKSMVVMAHKCHCTGGKFYYEVLINMPQYELLCLCISLCFDSLLFLDRKDLSKKDLFSSVKDIFEERPVFGGLPEFFSKVKKD